MLKILALSLLFLLSAPALAIHKCEIDGRISYSDVPCQPGESLPLNGAMPDKVSELDSDSAKQRAAREKKELHRVEKERDQADALDAKNRKERQKIAKADTAHKRKCAALALKQKWNDEDAAAATFKSAERAKRAARRQAEKYELECGQ